MLKLCNLVEKYKFVGAKCKNSVHARGLKHSNSIENFVYFLTNKYFLVLRYDKMYNVLMQVRKLIYIVVSRHKKGRWDAMKLDYFVIM